MRIYQKGALLLSNYRTKNYDGFDKIRRKIEKI